MTDNQIIKALDCCNIEHNCTNCPLKRTDEDCIERLEGESHDLNKRQQAEIKKLKKELRACIKKIDRNRKTVINKALREFAKRLKDMYKHNKTSVVSLVTVFDNINNLVKEMTEGDNGAK
jgi:Zn-dependent oligopeptidase